MTLASALALHSPSLQPSRITCAADKDLRRLEVEIFLAHLLGKDRGWILTHLETELSARDEKKLASWVARRQKHEPVAYILGEKEFYGRKFFVNKNVLVPRPETELFIDRAKELFSKDAAPFFWDVGTGSGAIAVTLATEFPRANLLASDVSKRALETATKNAGLNGCAKRLDFVVSDLLSGETYRHLAEAGKKHPHLCIAANLPYLPDADRRELEPDVTDFEPERALYSGDDGLDLIRRFFGQLSRHLTEWNFTEVTLFFEFDPPQTKEMKKLATALIEKVAPRESSSEILKDLAGKDRLLEIRMTR